MKHFILTTLLYANVSFADIPATPPNVKTTNQKTANVTKSQTNKPDPRTEKIIGRWETRLEGMLVFFEFKPNQQCDAGQGDDARSGTCTMNFTTTPHQLDFLIDDHPGYSIFEFTPDGLRIARPDEEKRPTEFSQTSLVFKRVDTQRHKGQETATSQQTPTPLPTQNQSTSPPQSIVLEDLVGRWEAELGGSTIYFEFQADQKCIVGENDSVKAGTFQVDFGTTPYHLNILIESQNGYTIFEVIPEGLRMAEPSDQESTRPTQFNQRSLVFKRVSTSPKIAPNSQSPQTPPPKSTTAIPTKAQP